MKKICILLAVALLILAGCGNNTNTTSTNKATPTPKTTLTPKPTPIPRIVPTEADVSQIVEMEMENGKTVKIGLCPQYAPETVANFVSLVKEGFYNGLTFHRVISGFMIQGGDPEGNGTGGSDKEIKGEFSFNGFSDNIITHARGVISMARSQMPDSASSQFFIVHQDSKFLDGQYAAFGVVLEGIEVVDEIAAAKTDANDKPTTPVVIKKMTVVKE